LRKGLRAATFGGIKTPIGDPLNVQIHGLPTACAITNQVLAVDAGLSIT
jgi:hypothetical protein